MRWRDTRKALRFRNAFFLFCGLTLIFAIVVANHSIPVLQIRDETDRPLRLHKIEREAALTHQYRHSVAKCPIIEKFVVDRQNRIVLMESWNCSFGAGIATKPPPGADQRLVEGFYVITNIRQVMPELAIHPVSFAEHRLTVDQETWNLSRPPFEGQTVTIRIQPMKRWQYWLHWMQAFPG